jgi:hypothetical protein
MEPVEVAARWLHETYGQFVPLSVESWSDLHPNDRQIWLNEAAELLKRLRHATVVIDPVAGRV